MRRLPSPHRRLGFGGVVLAGGCLIGLTSALAQRDITDPVCVMYCGGSSDSSGRDIFGFDRDEYRRQRQEERERRERQREEYARWQEELRQAEIRRQQERVYRETERSQSLASLLREIVRAQGTTAGAPGYSRYWLVGPPRIFSLGAAETPVLFNISFRWARTVSATASLDRLGQVAAILKQATRVLNDPTRTDEDARFLVDQAGVAMQPGAKLQVVIDSPVITPLRVSPTLQLRDHLRQIARAEQTIAEVRTYRVQIRPRAVELEEKIEKYRQEHPNQQLDRSLSQEYEELKAKAAESFEQEQNARKELAESQQAIENIVYRWQ